MISVWGIDHGFGDEIAKKWDKGQKRAGKFALLGPLGGAYGAGSQAKKGKGGKVAAKAWGRASLEGSAGAALGASAGSAMRSPVAAGILGTGGLIGGSVHGAGSSVGNSRKLGYLKSK